MKLFELTHNYQQVLNLIEDGADFELYEDTLESIEEGINDKAENTAKLIKSIEGDILALKAEEKRLNERRTSLENQVKHLKEYLQHNLEICGLTKVKGQLFTIGIQNNPASVKVLDESKIPEHYFVPHPSKLDRKALKEAFKNGELVEGAEFTQGQSLRIR